MEKAVAEKEAPLAPIRGQEDVASEVEEGGEDEEGIVGETKENIEKEKKDFEDLVYSEEQSESEEDTLEVKASILATKPQHSLYVEALKSWISPPLTKERIMNRASHFRKNNEPELTVEEIIIRYKISET